MLNTLVFLSMNMAVLAVVLVVDPQRQTERTDRLSRLIGIRWRPPPRRRPAGASRPLERLVSARLYRKKRRRQKDRRTRNMGSSWMICWTSSRGRRMRPSGPKVRQAPRTVDQ